tara:strand:- start:356 stop:1783 length:1428 start_codon:yes stop_codon:yes gene_type:complete
VTILLAAQTAFIGCEEVDDQAYTPDNALESVNPTPKSRGFVENNNRHEILMAVIDSGTDYNHPLIAGNFHFDLEDGKPVGIGYDYTGEDRWPAPYVALTSHLNPHMDQKGKEKGLLIQRRTGNLRDRFPLLSKFLDPLRNILQERESGAYHGTHVGGLMVYDEPRLGLIPYRVLPVNKIMKDGNEDWSAPSKSEIVFEQIRRAVNDALSKGVRVINFSLSLNQREDGGGALLSGAASEAELREFREKMESIKKIALENPSVAFVAAAGNEGQWISEDSALQLPCGISAPNILCVGALNDRNSLASFSNILLSDYPFVAAPGEDILSLFPTKMCNSDELKQLDSDDSSWPYDSVKSRKRHYRDLEEECSKSESGLKVASGTSMASPIVARMIGKILLQNPSLSGSEAINVLINRGENLQMGPLGIQRLVVERPSWYPRNSAQTNGPLLNPISNSGEVKQGWFELYIKKPDQKSVEI